MAEHRHKCTECGATWHHDAALMKNELFRQLHTCPRCEHYTTDQYRPEAQQYTIKARFGDAKAVIVIYNKKERFKAEVKRLEVTVPVTFIATDPHSMEARANGVFTLNQDCDSATIGV